MLKLGAAIVKKWMNINKTTLKPTNPRGANFCSNRPIGINSIKKSLHAIYQKHQSGKRGGFHNFFLRTHHRW